VGPYAWAEMMAAMHSTGIEREERYERSVQFSIPTNEISSHPWELFICSTAVGVRVRPITN